MYKLGRKDQLISDFMTLVVVDALDTIPSPVSLYFTTWIVFYYYTTEEDYFLDLS